LEEKGTSFVYPGLTVYEGMLIGDTQVDSEILLNPGKGKRLTNVRSVHKKNIRGLVSQKFLLLKRR